MSTSPIECDDDSISIIENITFPVAETFVYPQGEGLYNGTMMLFVRLAGCSVGKPFTSDTERSAFRVYNNYQTMCTSWDGRNFACDTNYNKSLSLSIKAITELAQSSNVERVCLTGGEPLMHKDVARLVEHLLRSGIGVHVETSGTWPLQNLRSCAATTACRPWITVSPKFGMLTDQVVRYADEVKLLIDSKLSEEDLDKMINLFAGHVIIWVQPINFEKGVHEGNMNRCLEIMRRYPFARLSLQTHKVIGCR